MFGADNPGPFVKDAFHEYVIGGRQDAVNPKNHGTKAAAHYQPNVPAGGQIVVQLRLSPESEAAKNPLGDSFDRGFADRMREADEFYGARLPGKISAQQKLVVRQAYAGLLMSKQFYHYVVKDWLEGDPGPPPPPDSRKDGRNREWTHLFNRDIISMPDKWEYPWYAAWDLAFHMVEIGRAHV